MGASISANLGNHCFINSKRGDSHPVHNSNPTRTRTYIYITPLHYLLHFYSPRTGILFPIGSAASPLELN